MSALAKDGAVAEAELLLDSLRTCTAVAPPRERIAGLTIDDAYAVQRELIGLRCRGGARRVGRKIGLTSLAMQEMLGVDQPDYGVLLDEMLVRATDGLDASQLIAPRVEAEIAFALRGALAGPDVGVEDVLAATRAIAPALEVIDSRVADWNIRIEDTVADNASSALVILGHERAVANVDLVAEEATVQVGRETVSGRGEAVLGHPAEAVAWLARALARHGEGLEQGDVVIPGAMARALPFSGGDVIRAEFSTLGSIEVTVR